MKSRRMAADLTMVPQHLASVTYMASVSPRHLPKTRVFAPVDHRRPTPSHSLLPIVLSLVQTVLATAPPRQVRAVLLVRYGGLSYAKAAQVMGVSVKTIGTHLTHFLRRLEAYLRGIDPPEDLPDDTLHSPPSRSHSSRRGAPQSRFPSNRTSCTW